MSVTVRAPAKINLHLGVGPVRDDGFHPLATAYQAIGLFDDVTVTEADTWSVSVRSDVVDVRDVPLTDDNIAVRAGRLLAAHHGLRSAAHIDIRKGIPVAGGMAGGSADAAAALVALDALWSLETPRGDLMDLAARLGSDVPFALVGRTALGSGRGEQVTSLDDRGRWWWVVVPDPEGLSTPSVYREFDRLVDTAPEPVVPGSLRDALASGSVESLGSSLANDLERAALSLRPDLAATFDAAARAGAVRVVLSGSGPTVLLLARDEDHALSVAAAMVAAGHQALVAPAPVAGARLLSGD